VSRPRAERLVVALTGASGAPYARRLLEVLKHMRAAGEGPEVAVVLSPTAQEVWALECGGDLRDFVAPLPIWGGRDYKAPFASGSAGWDAMVIVPCSMSTVARVAHGTSDSLLTRAADVMIKERRNLVVVPRETPLSPIHLENLLALARLGVTVLPAMPSFYGQPTSVEAVLDTVVARVLDHLGLPNDLTRRWGEPAATP
jgi:4-hydroxy-3-polyprenylbenzoate decarboxylase